MTAERHRRFQKWSLPAVLFGFLLGASGYFKGFLPNAPVDLTLLGLVGTGLVIFAALVMKPRRIQGHWPLLFLWLTFVPAVFIFNGSPLADSKAALLFTVTLSCALIPALFDRNALRLYVALTILAGSLTAFALLSSPTSDRGMQTGRLDVGVSTISSSRMVGAGVLALLLLVRWKPKIAVPALAAAIFGVFVMLQIGSRGPVVSLIVALLVAIAASKSGSGASRFMLFSLLVACGSLVLHYVVQADLPAVERISSTITGESWDAHRAHFYDVAMSNILANPVGLGWSGFSVLPEVAVFRSRQGELYPHNLFLEIGVEGGVFPLLVSVVLVAFGLHRLRRVSGDPMGQVLFALAAYWVLVAQTSSDINGNRMTWMSIGVALLPLGVLRSQSADSEVQDQRRLNPRRKQLGTRLSSQKGIRSELE